MGRSLEFQATATSGQMRGSQRHWALLPPPAYPVPTSDSLSSWGWMDLLPLSPLAWRVWECLTEDLGSVCCSLGFLPLSFQFPFLCLRYAAEKQYSLTKARRHIWSLFLPFFQTEKTPVCRAIGFNSLILKWDWWLYLRKEAGQSSMGVSLGWFIHHRQECLKT